MKKIFTLALLASVTFTGCEKNIPEADNSAGDIVVKPKLILKYKFDSTQTRLDNKGAIATIPDGNAAQTPKFNLMGAHYIELSKANDIPAYNGMQLYKSPEKNGVAIDFDNALYGKDGEQFFSIDLDKITPATYKYLRVSLSYQNYDIAFRSQGFDLTGTLASFVGAETYIDSYKIKNETVTVNGAKSQGYWAFETNVLGTAFVNEGQAPATTVPNPLFASSPIPTGSCLVTGEFPSHLTITGNETKDIVVEVSVSINNSFEWKDNGNNVFEPTIDQVVDMGVRGLIPIVQ